MHRENPRVARHLAASVSVILGLTFVLANAPVALALSYTYNCSGSQQTTHFQVEKDVSATNYWIKGVIGDVTNKNLNACGTIGGNFGSQYDVPFVLAANIQDYGDATTSNIVQLGYGRCEISGCIIPADSNQHLLYTPSDHAGGAVASAESWYHALVDNDRYRMKIVAITCTSPGTTGHCWELSVRDVSKGEAYVTHKISMTWNVQLYKGGNFAWWGSETNNVNSQMGVTDTNSDFDMDYMQYLTTQSGAQWTVRQGMSSCSFPDGTPSGYHCAISTTVYTKDTLASWTTPH
jgi:hypothetical protein